jgi:Phospholipid-translocating P-type ATPase C-terminal
VSFCSAYCSCAFGMATDAALVEGCAQHTALLFGLLLPLPSPAPLLPAAQDMLETLPLATTAMVRYLSRLLLLHGRWAYLRNREVVLYSFYKNWAYVVVYIYLQFVAGL